MKAFRSLAIVLAFVGCSPQAAQPPPGPNQPKVPEEPKNVPPPPEPEKNALERAIDHLRGGEVDEAMAALDEQLESDPKDSRAKGLLAQVLQEKAQVATRENRWDLAGPLLLKSAELARQIRHTKGLKIDTEGLFITATYNEACTYSRLGEVDKALDSLEESLQAGFLDQRVSGGPTTRELLVSDPDLDAIRETDRFQQLKAHYLKEGQPVAPPSHDPSTS
ncbi:MAG: tetratricopeptide repeat protein [Isosphaeraceae bacterium]